MIWAQRKSGYFGIGMIISYHNKTLLCQMHLNYSTESIHNYISLLSPEISQRTGNTSFDAQQVCVNGRCYSNKEYTLPHKVNQWRMCWMGSCYLVRDKHPIPGTFNWLEAEQFCQLHDGHLLSINSEAEYLNLISWLVNKRWKYANQYRFSSQHLRASWMFLGLLIKDQV